MSGGIGKQRKWIYSANQGAANRRLAASPAFFPEGLKTLRLDGRSVREWDIQDTRFLEKMTQLTVLDLSHNKISDGRFLERLTQPTSLLLYNNQISDGRFLEKLTRLTCPLPPL